MHKKATAMKSIRSFVLLVCLALATPAFASTASAAETAAPVDAGALEVVTQLQQGLSDVMRRADELGFQGRVDQLESLLEECFDTSFMAQKSIGRTWKKLSDADRERWLAAFRRMTTATYADRFEGGTGEWKTLGQEPAGHGTTLVRTKLIVPDEDAVEINYRMRKTDAGWRVIDLYLNGTVSELALRIAEYRSVLKREGIDGLIGLVDGKTNELAAAGAIQ